MGGWKMAGATLDAKGWHLSTEGIEQCTVENNKREDKIIELAKDTDLKEIGRKWLPDDVNKGSCEYVEGPGVLQIQKIRNIAAPKDNEESQGAPRLLKLTLTDGQLMCNGVEIEKLDKFGLDVPPGSKVLLKGTVAVEHGFLMLSNKNCQLIGGRVQKLAETWELKKMLSKQAKQRGVTEGGPPPFVPFGHRIQENKGGKAADNFKSLTAKKEEKKEEGEFEQQRQATIAEALQAKEEKTKTFGGGQKQVGSDKDIARIMEMGFSAEQASSALKQNNGNFQLAINHLLQGRGGARQNQYGGDRDRKVASGGRDVQGKQLREDRRDNRSRRQKEEVEEISSKPSAPVTLFDFLSQSNKLPVDADNKENKDTKPYNSVPSKSMQNTSDGSRQSYKPKYQDVSSKYESQSDRRNFDSRPKSSPAYNSQKSSTYDGRSQKQDRTDLRNKQEDRYSDRGQGNRSQQNYGDRNYRNDKSQNQGDRYSSQKGQNYSNERGPRNQQQNYDRRWEQDRNFNDSKRSNQYNDRQQNYDKRNDSGRRQNFNNRDSQNHENVGRSSNQNSYDKDTRRNREEYSSGRNEPRNNNFIQNNRREPQNKQSQDFEGNFRNSERTFQGQSDDYKSRKKDFPNNTVRQFPNPNQKLWNIGDHCLAKYWEDNQYYHAVIQQRTEHTAVVLFLDYGNSEELMLTDLKQLSEVPPPDFSVPPPGMFTYNMPPPQPANQPNTTTQIQTMEFRRRKTDYDKPDMQFYQPPKQRHN